MLYTETNVICQLYLKEIKVNKKKTNTIRSDLLNQNMHFCKIPKMICEHIQV